MIKTLYGELEVETDLESIETNQSDCNFLKRSQKSSLKLAKKESKA